MRATWTVYHFLALIRLTIDLSGVGQNVQSSALCDYKQDVAENAIKAMLRYYGCDSDATICTHRAVFSPITLLVHHFTDQLVVLFYMPVSAQRSSSL
jgi:hypothetical protein